MMLVPLRYMGEGEFRVTNRGFAARCDRELVVGQVLRWEQVSERSAKSHRHYFAQLADYWASLPEGIADELPTPEHLRKFALIKAGYCDIDKIVCANNSEALSLVALLRRKDSYAVIEVVDRVVTVRTAHSQSEDAMKDGKTFQESKEKVLDIAAALVGSKIEDEAA